MRTLPPNKSDAVLRERLNGQGFLHAGTRCLYSRDPYLHCLNQLTAMCLGAYPDVDHAAVTDKKRTQALKDLPSNMEDIATTLWSQTGVEIWMVRVWCTPEGRLVYYR
ncbi:hypothetical protein FRC12_004570 [Ceratobasidium sp. 428]|nr:hypothetical protein FRC12_004570 [Ceratobasidium sp. 428]